jgi:hypothetical protein
MGRDAAGNLYLLGTYVGAPVLSNTPITSQGDSDMFLAKYSPSGALIWLRTLQSSGGDQASALVVEPSGRCTLAGFFGNTTGGNLTFVNFNSSAVVAGPVLLGLASGALGYEGTSFIAAVDANGTLLWADNPSPTYGLSVSALHRDGMGNCYLSANTRPQSALVFNGQNYPPIGSTDAVLMKYTAAGQPAWARRVGATGGTTVAGAIKTDAANALYWNVNHNRTLVVDGRTIPFATASNPVTQGSNTLFKVSIGNALIWAKNSLLKNVLTNAQGAVTYIDQTTNSMYMICGSYGGTITSDTAPSTSLSVPAGAYGTCVARCDTSGTVQWIRPIAYASVVAGGASWAAIGVVDIFPDVSGFTAVTNTAYAARTVFPNNNIFDINRSGLPCVSHYNYATGQCDWIRTGGVTGVYGSVQGSTAVASAIDAAGNVFVAGAFTGSGQFGTIPLSSTTPSQPDFFLAKLDQSTLTSTSAQVQGKSWSVFPNPAAGTAQLAGLPATAQVRVYDAQGRLVRTLPPVATADAPRALGGLASGLYLLHVSNTAEAYRSQRLLMQ